MDCGKIKKKYILFLIYILFIFITLPSNAQQNSKKQYERQIAIADSLDKAKNYEAAMKAFQKASDIMPLEEYPRNKIQQIEYILTNQPRKEEIKEESEKLEGKPAVEKSVSSKELIEQYVQTLEKIEKIEDSKEKSNSLAKLADTLRSANYKSKALELYKKSLEIVKEEGDVEKAAEITEDIAEVYLDSGLYKTSIEKYQESIDLKDQVEDKKGVSNAMENVGNIYESTYNFDEAINYYEKSAQIRDSIDDKEGLSKVMDNMGNIYYRQQFLEKSIDSYKKSAEIYAETNNEKELGTTYNKMGVAYYELGQLDDAEDFYTKSLEIKEKSNMQKEASMTLNNLGNINFEKNKLNKAIDYYEKSLNVKKDIGFDEGNAYTLYNMANVYRRLNMPEKAIEYFEQSKTEAEKHGQGEVLVKNMKVLATLYRQTGDLNKALNYESRVNTSEFRDIDVNEQISENEGVEDVVDSQRMIKFLTDEVLRQKAQAEEEAEKRKLDNKLNAQRLQLQKEQLTRQRIFLVSMGLVIVLVLIMTMLIYRQMLEKKRTNQALTEKNVLITKQQKLITDNIKSASSIQQAALPLEDVVKEEFPEHFVLNMPKDIVSGDFYWMEKRKESTFIAVADCTGHGVQGAVVSMLGIAILNEIVNKSYNNPPGKILDQLSKKVKAMLHQSESVDEIREGMDITLIKFADGSKKIEFAGANNPLYIVRGKEILEFKGDRSPIGYYSKGKPFTTQEIDVKAKDTLYMFSDGYSDQIGGEHFKKFLPRRFRQLLIDINSQSMEERKESLVKNFNTWRGTYQQVDDIIVMGIKV